MQQRRLYRSEQDRMVAGVCAGLGAYFGVDPTVVRVAFAALALAGGTGIALYLVMWVIVPVESRGDAPPPEVAREGIEDIKDRARQAGREAREALDRVRGRDRGQPGDPGTGQSA